METKSNASSVELNASSQETRKPIGDNAGLIQSSSAGAVVAAAGST
jgi:hypothetical protein